MERFLETIGGYQCVRIQKQYMATGDKRQYPIVGFRKAKIGVAPDELYLLKFIVKIFFAPIGRSIVNDKNLCIYVCTSCTDSLQTLLQQMLDIVVDDYD